MAANPPFKSNAINNRVSASMQLYWTNFAKTGDPNGPGLPVWPKFAPDTRSYISFTGAGPVAKPRAPSSDRFAEITRF